EAVFQIATAAGPAGFDTSSVRLKPVGADPNARIVGLEPLSEVTIYCIGSDPNHWRTNVPGYAKVRYDDIYPGIDLVYYGNSEGSVEYDFVVDPGADPNRIIVSIEGAEDVTLDPAGNLSI